MLGDKNLSEGSVRIGFIRKVYSILAAQLTMTAAFTSYVCFSDSAALWLQQNVWLLGLCCFVTIICMYALGCYPSVARSVPTNYILLTLFTACESVMVATICSIYERKSVFIAAVLTATVVIALTIYAFTTKSDFTICGGFLFALVAVLLVASIIAIFVRNRWLQLAISVFAVLLFSIYIIYDTQLIIGNKARKLSVDDYIFAAMMLYIDIIQLFLEILKLLGDKK